MQTVYLVDASIYIFRSWFSMPDAIENEYGESINAVYGYLLFIAKFLDSLPENNPGKIAFAFDESLDSCFRNRIYPMYKSSRGLPDENLAMQLKACRKLTEALGLKSLSSRKYEADDLIGSLSKQFRNRNRRFVILTRDKDLGQLLRSEDQLWDFADDSLLDRLEFERKFGVSPERFPEYLGLVGDKVDDIPGVQDVGAKKALSLLENFEDLEDLYSRIDEVSTLKIRGAQTLQQKLLEHKELAFISRKLARIHCELEPVNSFRDLDWRGVDERRFKSALSRFAIKGRTRTALENAFRNHYRT